MIRANTYVIHCSLIDRKNRSEITDIVSLPFDDEIREMNRLDAEEMLKGYWELVKSGALN